MWKNKANPWKNRPNLWKSTALFGSASLRATWKTAICVHGSTGYFPHARLPFGKNYRRPLPLAGFPRFRRQPRHQGEGGIGPRRAAWPTSSGGVRGTRARQPCGRRPAHADAPERPQRADRHPPRYPGPGLVEKIAHGRASRVGFRLQRHRPGSGAPAERRAAPSRPASPRGATPQASWGRHDATRRRSRSRTAPTLLRIIPRVSSP